MKARRRLLRIKSAPALEERLEEIVSSRLRRRRRQTRGYAQLSQRTLETRPEGMNHAAYLRFRLLHRQFAGVGAPGLPTVVATGRFLWRKLRRLREKVSR